MSEANNTLSRKQVELAPSLNLFSGTVLGKNTSIDVYMPLGVPFIGEDEAYVILMGANIFRTWFGPADSVETANQIGLPLYAKQKPLDFYKGVQLHTQSNPLPLCLKPRAVIKCTLS